MGEVRAAVPWPLRAAVPWALALIVPPSRLPTNGVTGGGGPWPFSAGDPKAPPRPPARRPRPGARSSPLLCPKELPLGLDAGTGEGEAEEALSLGRRSLESDRRHPALRDSRLDSAAEPSFSLPLSRERIRSRRRCARQSSTSSSLAITRRTRPWLPRPPSRAAVAPPDVPVAEAPAAWLLEVAELATVLRCRRLEFGLLPDGAAAGPVLAPSEAAEAVLLLAAALLLLAAALPSGEAVAMLAVEAVRGILIDVAEPVRRFFMRPRPVDEPKPQGVFAAFSPPVEAFTLLPAEPPPEEPPAEAGGRGSDEKLTFRVSEDALLSLPNVGEVRPPSSSGPSGRERPLCG
mmetsp:Transcript_156306/g.277356  ORF Transcript_156306/g.277356 Transcript_156306/m.277356 type:complete len:347 (+) Transcript_156306:2294-3334(+)